MTQEPDIRWHQRLKSFQKALFQLKQSVSLSKEKKLTGLETQGLIKAFEFTYELSWKVMKDFFNYQGNSDIMGARDAIRESFKSGLIDQGESWMEMIKSRNQTSHCYNEDTAYLIAEKITHTYLDLFLDFETKIKARQENE